MMKAVLRLFGVILVFCLLISLIPSGSREAGGRKAVVSLPSQPFGLNSWIIQWKDKPDPGFAENSEVVVQYPDSRIVVARPKPGKETSKWTNLWKKSDFVESFQHNQTFRAAKVPNDPLQSKQKYLQQIGAEAAWEEQTGSGKLTVAIVDTGVDLQHPDLIPNLVPGVNLINPGQPPQDENGHGTNVAGVIAAAGDNDKGVAGLLWHTRIMPIKALESNGTGEEDKLGEGIRYAVDHGARIVVLSLGLNKPSAYMESVVRYAESKGVLLVAASGNEGGAVKYPAAYPTVLAVGGATADNQAVSLSNSGPELDVVAPWSVFTTFPGGKYNFSSGTSMAAPQAAAVSALLWNKYPDMKPYQIRSMIRQTAQDLGTKGWDARTGWGLLRADRALTMTYRDDGFENNDIPANAAVIPINNRIDAALGDANDADWYVIDVPLDGSLSVQLNTDKPNAAIELLHSDSTSESGTLFQGELDKGITFEAEKGKHYIRISGSQAREALNYHLTTRFSIGKDAFEDNDRQYMAYTLSPRSRVITGTFHRSDDEDWYAMNVERDGMLRLKISADSARMDLALLVLPKGGKEARVDQTGDGAAESILLEVHPGTYYFRVSALGSGSYMSDGRYTMDVEYATDYEDPNEPNDKPYQSAAIRPDTEYSGVFDSPDDADWFMVKTDKENGADFVLSGIPDGVKAAVQLLDHSLNHLDSAETDTQTGGVKLHARLKEGTYYIKLTADRKFNRQMYSLVWKSAKP